MCFLCETVKLFRVVLFFFSFSFLTYFDFFYAVILELGCNGEWMNTIHVLVVKMMRKVCFEFL